MVDKKSLLLFAGTILFIIILLEIIIPHPDLKDEFCQHDMLGYTLCPNLEYSNSLGYHDLEFKGKPNTLLIGDSLIMEIAQSFDKTVASQFENKTCRKTFNLGISGYSPIQYALTFDKFMNLKPEYVFIFFTPTNDFAEMDPSLAASISPFRTYVSEANEKSIKTYRLKQGIIKKIGIWLMKKSDLAYFIYFKYMHLKNKFYIGAEYYSYITPIDPRIEKAMKISEQLFDHILYQAKKRDIKVIFITSIVREKVDQETWEYLLRVHPKMKKYDFDLNIPAKWMKNYAQSRNVPYIDLNKELLKYKKGFFIPNDGHYTDYGTELIADVLKKEVGSECN